MTINPLNGNLGSSSLSLPLKSGVEEYPFSNTIQKTMDVAKPASPCTPSTSHFLEETRELDLITVDLPADLLDVDVSGSYELFPNFNNELFLEKIEENFSFSGVEESPLSDAIQKTMDIAAKPTFPCTPSTSHFLEEAEELDLVTDDLIDTSNFYAFSPVTPFNDELFLEEAGENFNILEYCADSPTATDAVGIDNTPQFITRSADPTIAPQSPERNFLAPEAVQQLPTMAINPLLKSSLSSTRVWERKQFPSRRPNILRTGQVLHKIGPSLTSGIFNPTG